MSQFVRLTALIQSDQPAAIAFRRLFEEQQRCGASGDACPVCGDGACGLSEASCNCPGDCSEDSDGDGLSDAWEAGGIDNVTVVLAQVT